MTTGKNFLRSCLNTANTEGYTPLMYALLKGNIHTAKVVLKETLLEDLIGMRDNENRTVVELAMKSNDINIKKMIFDILLKPGELNEIGTQTEDHSHSHSPYQKLIDKLSTNGQEILGTKELPEKLQVTKELLETSQINNKITNMTNKEVYNAAIILGERLETFTKELPEDNKDDEIEMVSKSDYDDTIILDTITDKELDMIRNLRKNPHFYECNHYNN